MTTAFPDISNEDREILNEWNLSNLVCFADTKDLAMQNNYAQKVTQSVRLRLLPCKGSKCERSSSKIKSYFKSRQFVSILQKSFVDFRDLNNSIKSIPNEEIKALIDLASPKKYEIRLKQVNFTYFDTFLQLISAPQETDFLAIDETS